MEFGENNAVQAMLSLSCPLPDYSSKASPTLQLPPLSIHTSSPIELHRPPPKMSVSSLLSHSQYQIVPQPSQPSQPSHPPLQLQQPQQLQPESPQPLPHSFSLSLRHSPLALPPISTLTASLPPQNVNITPFTLSTPLAYSSSNNYTSPSSISHFNQQSHCEAVSNSSKLRILKRPYKKYYSNPTPSSHCHVCARTSKAVKFVVCARIRQGLCRKVICYKCFSKFGWDWNSAINNLDWVCVHCRGECPEGRSQCFIYARVNSRRGSKRKRAQLNGEDSVDLDRRLAQKHHNSMAYQ